MVDRVIVRDLHELRVREHSPHLATEALIQPVVVIRVQEPAAIQVCRSATSSASDNRMLPWPVRYRKGKPAATGRSAAPAPDASIRGAPSGPR
jgi:hypothetical protein